ncbi:MAG TPA: XylR family transcriptional regulator [Caulifigura sp.]|nr:XylR family transcriptional regulator [Caulifigura sp.]
MPQPVQIAVLIDTEDNWGRRVVAGISEAARNLAWELLIAPRDDQWRLRVPFGWDGHGVIAAMRDRQTATHIRRLDLPTVNVSSWGFSQTWCVRIVTDDRQRAVLALNHFRERGYEHFAYFGPPSQRYSNSRRDHFQRAVNEAGLRCSIFSSPLARQGWSSMRNQVAQWLQSLPRPLAVFTADPHPALQLSQICRAEGIRVPNDVAILAGDTDELLCELAVPPISSVVLAGEHIGALSVQALSGLLQGRRQDPVTFVPPIRIAERQSTDLLAIDDSFFAEAVQYVRRHAHTGIHVRDILRVVPVSRRQLELKFQQYLQRSPAEEIRRVKIERAQQLLTSTSMNVRQISQAVGFASVSRFCVMFRQMIGQTPLEFRALHRTWRM